jgi:hypothetical protein
MWVRYLKTQGQYKWPKFFKRYLICIKSVLHLNDKCRLINLLMSADSFINCIEISILCTFFTDKERFT